MDGGGWGEVWSAPATTMPRSLNRLSDRLVRTAGPGLFADGGNLYLLVKASGSKSWVFRYRDRSTGKLRDKGLGPLHSVTLKAAREKAHALRAMLLEGGDPIDTAREARAAAAVESAKAMTFGHCASAYIAAHRAGWRNAKHGQQWGNTLKQHAALLMPLPVAAIDTALVLKVVEPIWTTTTETATRVRQRIEKVLDWATTRGYRTGDNPARLRGHLENLLPKARKVSKVIHMPAMPYADVPAFVEALRKRPGLSARALEYIILTAARASEAVGATWGEIDLDAAVWTVPAERMKAGRPHRVPLSDASVSLLRDLYQEGVAPSGYVFPGARRGRAMTIAAPLRMLQRDMTKPDLTVHGFRSSFRDWAAERTAFAREVIEASLAHVVRDQTEAAYFRSDVLAKRAKLAQAWADFLKKPTTGASVVPIRAATAE